MESKLSRCKHCIFAALIFILLSCRLTQAASPLCGFKETIGDPPNPVTVLYLWGSPYERGYAHGKLCAPAVKQLVERLLAGAALIWGGTPTKLQEAWQQMEPFVPPPYKEEMRGLAEGAGISLQHIQWAHAIPDLSEFHCTFYAAWGNATRDGHLHQIRALDYVVQAGIQAYPALIVQRSSKGHVFVNIGWLGFLGCVSGMNTSHIAVSEIGEHFGDEHETLAGEPMPFVLREVLEKAQTIQEAVRIIRKAPRTSSYLYCIGDAKIPAACALRTAKDIFEVYYPHNYPGERLENVVYWSMGCESKWNKRVYEVLKAHWGKISHRTGTAEVMRGLGTGNLHAVAYDVTALKLWVANATPGPQIIPAYQRRFVPFYLRQAAEKLAQLAATKP